MNLKIRSWTLIALVALLTSTMAAPIRADDADPQWNYNRFCTKCHGMSGKGNGPASATLETRPRDFGECARMAKLSDDRLFKSIKFGGKAAQMSGDMPSWHDGFEDSEIKDLVTYVRTFCKQ